MRFDKTIPVKIGYIYIAIAENDVASSRQRQKNELVFFAFSSQSDLIK